MDKPAYRYLRGFALDPGFSTRLDTATINQVVYRIPFEWVEPGPIGEYLEVMDWDPASGCWYDPIDLGSEEVASQQGLTPSEGNPRFHQQFVYTVAMKTITHFERALGRKVIWKPRRMDGPDDEPLAKGDPLYRYVPRLRVHPHAFRDANAYYDPTRVNVLFGYFEAADQLVGGNLPGGTIFTCLSPDIIAHEITHALLDSVHQRYMEDTNPDVGAFHEGFADIVALLSRFTFRELVEHQLYQSGGRMDRYTVLGELATQFGEAIEGYSGALRSAIGHWTDKGWEPQLPDPGDYANVHEAHDRGALLVATVFDAFQRVYAHHTRDLLRIATNGTGVLPEGSIGRDLVHRLAGEAGQIAEHLLHICIRALDYCPPTDITFGNYLRALVTADLDIAPEDESGFRIALIEAFRARGIFPERVSSMSPESLRWNTLVLAGDAKDFFRETLHAPWSVPKSALRPGENKRETDLITMIRELATMNDRKAVYELSQRAQALFQIRLMRKLDKKDKSARESFLHELGLTGKKVDELFDHPDAKTEKLRFVDRDGEPFDDVPPIEVHAVRPVFRAGREGRQIEQVLITLTQTVRVKHGSGRNADIIVFRGGGSLVLTLNDLEQDMANPAAAGGDRIDYAILKNIRSWERFVRQREYVTGGGERAFHRVRDTYAGNARARSLNLRHLHQH